MEKENMYTLLNIDAWRDGENGWYWNNMHKIEDDIFISPEISDSPRKLLAFMRRNNWLTAKSKGMLKIEDTGFDIEIQNKNTGEPILAFRPQWPM